jgi:hypothetical protein
MSNFYSHEESNKIRTAPIQTAILRKVDPLPLNWTVYISIDLLLQEKNKITCWIDTFWRGFRRINFDLFSSFKNESKHFDVKVKKKLFLFFERQSEIFFVRWNRVKVGKKCDESLKKVFYLLSHEKVWSLLLHI